MNPLPLPLPLGQYPVTIRRLSATQPSGAFRNDSYVVAEFVEGYHHLFAISAGYPRGDYARDALRTLVNSALQGIDTELRLDHTGTNFEECLRECVGVTVLANVVERQSRNNKKYTNPTFRAGFQHHATAILRRAEWGMLAPAEMEYWLGEAERRMETSDRAGDPTWADGWAALVAWCTKNMH